MERASRSGAAAAIIVALGTIAYLPAFRAGFVFDDHELVENGRLLRGPLAAIWFGTTAPDYWPLTYTGFWLEWRLFGSNPAGYHAVNVALHLAAAMLLWRVLSRLGLKGAWLAGLLFALHPVAVESVAWISELKNVLSGVLFLGSILAWLRFERDRTLRARATAVALFGAALLAKVSVAVLPVILIGLAFERRGRITRRDALDLAPLFVLALVAGVGNLWFQHHNALGGGWTRPRELAAVIGGAGWALASYLEKAYVPVRLALLYPPWPFPPSAALFWAPLAGLGALAALLWRFRAGWGRPLLLALGYHALCVAPVVGFVDMAFLRLAPVSNHLQYLALMGPAALVAWLLARLAARARALSAAATAAVAVALCAATFGRASAFQDDLALWQAAARDAPRSAIARQELGNQLLAAGRLEEGIAELEQALALSPDPGSQHGIRSSILLLQGRTPEAAAEARAVLAATDMPELVSDAAWTLVHANRAEEAIPALTALVRRMPGSSEYAYRLSSALARTGRTPEAIGVLYGYCAGHPGHPRMEAALAFLLVRSGRVDEARARAAAVLGVDPADPRAEAQLRAWYAAATGSSQPPAER